MIRPVSFSICVCAGFLIVLLAYSRGFSQSVRFDCPASASAELLEPSLDNKVVQIIVPVSTTVSDTRLQLNEIKTEVFWNRNAYPLVDYGPKTALQSMYDGPVSVEKRTETDFNIGAKVSSGYFELVTPSLDANAGRKNSETRSYNEIPQREVAIASGPIKRGTGAYFQFKPTRTESLEGGRDLVVAFEVPASWRGGVLQVTCKAAGKRTKLGIFSEDFVHARVYVVPVYLKGDDQARKFAFEFARSEQRLRQGWSLYAEKSNSGSHEFFGLVSSSNEKIPDLWMHHLIQSGSDVAMRRVESRLPEKVALAANRFVEARQELSGLSR